MTLPKGIPLTSLAVDASARFCDADCAADDRDTLRALGLIDGATLRVCNQGEPCVVQVRSTRIGITRRVAESILVEPTSDRVRLPG